VGGAVAAADFQRCYPSLWQISWGKEIGTPAASSWEIRHDPAVAWSSAGRVLAQTFPGRALRSICGWGLVFLAGSRLALGAPFVEPKAPPRQRPLPLGSGRRVGRGALAGLAGVRASLPGSGLAWRPDLAATGAGRRGSRLPRRTGVNSRQGFAPGAGLLLRVPTLSAQRLRPLCRAKRQKRAVTQKGKSGFTSSWAYSSPWACFSLWGNGTQAWATRVRLGISSAVG